MIRLLHEARRRLKTHRRSAAVIGAARIITWIIGLLAYTAIQRLLRSEQLLPAESFSSALNLDDLMLLGTLLTALTALSPLRVQTAWQLGRISGTLDQNDLGFLAQSSSLWLWTKAIFLRLVIDLLMLSAAVPMFVLYIAAKSIWLTIPPETEGLLPLLTVLHLGLLTIAAGWLPLRIYAAGTALPYCYLKAPHESLRRIIRLCLRLTRTQTLHIITLRMFCFPAMILPFTAIDMLPVLLTAEQIRCERAWRHLPRRSSRFAHLELHAYELTNET